MHAGRGTIELNSWCPDVLVHLTLEFLGVESYLGIDLRTSTRVDCCLLQRTEDGKFTVSTNSKEIGSAYGEEDCVRDWPQGCNLVAACISQCLTLVQRPGLREVSRAERLERLKLSLKTRHGTEVRAAQPDKLYREFWDRTQQQPFPSTFRERKRHYQVLVITLCEHMGIDSAQALPLADALLLAVHASGV